MKKKYILPTIVSLSLSAAAATSFAMVLGVKTARAEEDTTSNPNLATGKTITASSTIGTDVPQNAIDNNTETKWSPTQGTPEIFPNGYSLTIDLEEPASIQAFKIQFKNNNVTHFVVEVSDNNIDWLKLNETNETSNLKKTHIIGFSKAKTGVRYVRLTIKSWTPDDTNTSGISVLEFSLYKKLLANPTQPIIDLPLNLNFARNKPVDVRNSLTWHPKRYAVDDSAKYFGSSWASQPNTPAELDDQKHWLTVDLEEPKTVRYFRYAFERPTVRRFKILVSSDNENWTVVSDYMNNHATQALIELPEGIKNIRWVKTQFLDWNPNGYSNIGVIDFGIFQYKPIITNISEYINEVNADENPVHVDLENNKIVLKKLPEGIALDFIGADYEQVIDANLNIIKPLTSKRIIYNLRIRNEATGQNKTSDNKTIVIPGLHDAIAEGKNTKPNIVPEITEWWSDSNENLSLSNPVSIYVKGTRSPRLEKVIKEIQDNYLEITGRNLGVNFGEKPENLNGQIVLDLTQNNIPGYDNETYGMNIDDNITIKATDITGIFYGSRTIMQILKLDPEKSNIPKGQIKDYPRFKVRSFMLDVARKPFELDTLKNLVKDLSWYKMNELHVHLSDNHIFLDDWVNAFGGDRNAGYKAYAGFRLESNINNPEGVNLASSDYHYTKQQFAELIEYARTLGVSIVPEISTSSHSLSITKLFQELGAPGRGRFGPSIDHLDISKPEALALAKKIWSEYIDNNGIFSKEKGLTLHIGADEFEANLEAFQLYLIEMFRFFQERGITIRFWAGLDQIKGVQARIPVELPEHIQANSWSHFWSRPDHLIDANYSIVEGLDIPNYIVPFGRDRSNNPYYNDNIDPKKIYDKFTPDVSEQFNQKYVLPAGSPQILGGTFALWADYFSDRRAKGLVELDAYRRIMNVMSAFATKLWGDGNDGLDLNYADFRVLSQKLGVAPNNNPEFNPKVIKDALDIVKYDFKGSSDEQKLFDKGGQYRFASELNNATLNNEGTENFLSLNGGNSSAKLPIGTIGIGNELNFRIRRKVLDTAQDEEIIFSGEWAYGDFSLKAKQLGSDKIGFSREGYNYTFEYVLPLDTWVDIKITNEVSGLNSITKLYVNGAEIGEARGNDGFGKTLINNTFLFPLSKIGNNVKSFKGDITNISLRSLSTITNDELTRLQNINLNFAHKNNKNSESLANNDITISGYNNATENIKVEKVAFDNEKRYAIFKVTRTSISDSTKKVVNQVLIENVENWFGKLKGELSEQLTAAKSLDNTLFTQNSRNTYIRQLEELNSRVTASPSFDKSNYESLSETRNNFKSSLTTYLQDLKNQIQEAKSSNISENTVASQQNYRTALDNMLQNLSFDDKISFDQYNSFIVKKDNLTSVLVPYIKVIKNKIIEDLRKDISKFTPSTQIIYLNKLNDLSASMNGNTSINETQYDALEKVREAAKTSLVTYIDDIKQKLDYNLNINLSVYTDASVNQYINELNVLIKEVSTKTSISATEYSNLNFRKENIRSVLITFRRSFLDKVNQILGNSNLYSVDSFKKFKKEIDGFLKQINNQAILITRQNFRTYNDTLSRIVGELVSLKSILIEKIRTELNVPNDLYLQSTVDLYKNSLGQILDSVAKQNEINSEAFVNYETQISTLKSFLTSYNKIIQEDIKNYKENVLPTLEEKYSVENKKRFDAAVEKIEKIANSEVISRREFDELKESFKNAQDTLLKPQSIPETNPKPPSDSGNFNPSTPTPPVNPTPIAPDDKKDDGNKNSHEIPTINKITNVFSSPIIIGVISAAGGLFFILFLALALRKKSKKKTNKK